MVLETLRLALHSVSLQAARTIAGGGVPDGLVFAPDYPVSRTHDAAERVGTLAEPNGIGMFLILRKADMRVIGDCSAERERTTNREVVWINYEVARSAQSEGYAKEAIKRLVDWLVEQPKVERVCAEIPIGNEPSQRVASRAGLAIAEKFSFGQVWCRQAARQANNSHVAHPLGPPS